MRYTCNEHFIIEAVIISKLLLLVIRRVACHESRCNTPRRVSIDLPGITTAILLEEQSFFQRKHAAAEQAIGSSVSGMTSPGSEPGPVAGALSKNSITGKK